MKQEKIRVGVIGSAGFIGSGHLHRLAAAIDGARPTAVYDVKRDKLETQAARYGVKIFDSADEMITSDEIDAVLIASWDATHAEFTQKCIAAGKPVFCEKPLATTLEDCKAVLEAEKQSGKTLVQVGFMRRFDPDYIKMKKIIQSGELGAPIMAHCISRTPKVASGFTDSMQVTNIAIHEIDVMRWLLDEPIVKGQMIYGRSTSFAEKGLHDPQLALMWSESGCLIDVECAANSYYGYEVQCEIVCEKGTIRLPDPPAPIVRSRLQCATEVMDDWSERFPKAYQAELQYWIDSIQGIHTEKGPGSEDGYAACAVADAMILSQSTKQPENVVL